MFPTKRVKLSSPLFKIKENMSTETVLSNNRNNEKEFSKLLGVLLSEGWIISGIDIDGSSTWDGSSYHIHLKRTINPNN